MNPSWLQPVIDLYNRLDWLVCVVPANSDRLVELVAKGSCELLIYENDLHLLSLEKDFLYAAVWHHLRNNGKLSNITITIYCHGIYRIPNLDQVCILIKLDQDQDQDLVNNNNEELRHAALRIWNQYQHDYSIWKKNKTEYDRSFRNRIEKWPEHVRLKMIELATCYFADFPESEPAKPSFNKILPLTPIGCWIPELPHHATARNNAVLRTLSSVDINPSRDGIYTMVIAKGAEDSKKGALLIWTPQGDLTGYPEIRSAVQQVIPSAFKKPRHTDISPPPAIILPEDTFERTPLEWTQINGPYVPESFVLHDVALENMDDFTERADRAREWVRASGFDAIGWYQPFHLWDEAHWGIYLHTDRLLDLACGFYSDLAHTQQRPDSLAVLLSVGLVAHHELFHAKVEASATSQELLTGKGRYLAYQKNVYQACKLTDEWLEEALANWAAYAWLQSHLDQFEDLARYQPNQTILSVVEEWLNFSPPGYRNWAAGRQLSSWRTLSSQLASGALGSKLKKGYPPLEGLLNGPLPFDLIDSDIPIWFVDQGAISDLYFSTPGRIEARRLLKHFGYQMIAGRGKGSHEIWTGPDKRSFSLPLRDPLSQGVFRSLLHHFELTKETYLKELRQELK